MKVIGIDLAGSAKNDTGFCFLEANSGKTVKTCILKNDDEIVWSARAIQPDIIAIDAPLTNAKNQFMRKCDEELHEYGTLPLNLRGMTYLVERGNRLGDELKKEFNVIEVLPVATAKILGFYDKEASKMQKSLANLGIDGDTKKRMLTKDELDSVSAALTGFLYLEKKTQEIGDEEGKIVVPKV